MAEISRGQVNYNTVAGSVGLAGAIPSLLNMLGFNPAMSQAVNVCPDNMPVNRYEMNLLQENAALKTEVEMHKAEIYSDNKREADNEKNEARFRAIENRLAEQAIFNERTTATVGCIAQQANGMNAILNSITQTVIPKDVICPAVMPMYNSWTAPTSTGTATT